MSDFIRRQGYQPLRIIYSDAATEHDGFNWKYSRHRKNRVLKKLLKRFGCYERRKPCAFKTADAIIAHPSMRAEIERQCKFMPQVNDVNGFKL